MVLNNIFIRVTDITDYYFCPRKVYLKRVMHYEEESTEQKIFGSIVHSIFDRINDKEKDIIYSIKENKGYEYILNLYNQFTYKLIEDILLEFDEEIQKLKLDKNKIKIKSYNYVSKDIEERAKNVYNFILESDLYGIELWENLEPKLVTEIDVTSLKNNIIGRVDRIEIYKDEMIPYEIKSGFYRREHVTQLYAYYLLLKDEYPKYKINKGYLLYAKDNYKKEIEFTNKKEIENILYTKDKIYNMIEEKKDPGKVYKDACKKCLFYNICWK
ncbi:CRISPR-associated exonuclease Csa1 [Nanobdella aerobiophila]|uniref:CRISPR-associated exonuclease Cas4 n=1 Tax=Nanobdella aerobiophila TaxID=2586965 RepID=A0A915WSD8_9ARCH|nr:CRISPR-associated protein Cas4 [Nanobdella aerobiophila]BBL45851.1 CRISPR-associated exonuclease Csa1 [Nanobdella aerobiophila]